MDDSIIKKQSEMTRDEWIRWCWVDVTEFAHKERHWLRGIERPISESLEAAEQFDLYWQVHNATEGK